MGGRSWHVAPWPRAEGERSLAGSAPLPSAWRDNRQCGKVRARKKLACCASSRETASAVTRPRVPRENQLILGGHSWHVAPRQRAEGERPLAGAVPLLSAWTAHDQRSTAHARSKLACCASSRETKRSGGARACHASAGWFWEAGSGTSYHGRAPKERGLSPVQFPWLAHGPTTTSASWHTHSTRA